MTQNLKITKPSKKIKGKGFEFFSDGHKYFLDGKSMTGVTTVLGVIAKPQLIGWAANQAIDYMEEKVFNSAFPLQSRKDFENWFKEARIAHRKTKEKAGTAGTDVHGVIEGIIKNALELTNGKIYPTEITKAMLVNEQVKHFVSWALTNNVRFLASEEKVFSRELFVAGTIDFICEIEKEVWIGDIKTSSAIYPEHFFQTAGYQRLMQDMAKTDGGMQVNIKGHVILNCRKDGTFEEKRSISNEDNMEAFMHALGLYRIKNKVEGNLI